jgi:hypothetical protein
MGMMLSESDALFQLSFFSYDKITNVTNYYEDVLETGFYPSDRLSFNKKGSRKSFANYFT